MIIIAYTLLSRIELPSELPRLGLLVNLDQWYELNFGKQSTILNTVLSRLGRLKFLNFVLVIVMNTSKLEQ